jgi:hypothetical protein
MNTLGAWYDPTTWFQDEVPDVTGTGGSFTTNPNNDPFGWSTILGGGQSTDIQAGVSDSQLADWNTYWASGGVMGADLSSTTPFTPIGTDSSDWLSGVNDFLKGITGVAQTGLGIWGTVQTIINQQNPSDQLVQIPGSSTPVVKRVVDGKTTFIPIVSAYPNLAPQVQQAQNSWIGPALIAGVLGIGLIVILKKD